MYKTVITPELTLASIAIPYTPLCVDCGGVRSYGSGQRCRKCFLILAARKRELKASRSAAWAAECERLRLLRAARDEEREAKRLAWAERNNSRLDAALAACERSRLLREQRREKRLLILKRRDGRGKGTGSRDVLLQPFNFHFGSVPKPSHVLRNAVSLDRPLTSSRRFGSGVLSDIVADPAPSILERMVEAEGVRRVIERLSDEKHIPLEQARRIVEALVDSDLLEDGGVCDLADMLRSGWQANRLLVSESKQAVTLASKPRQSNPEPYQYGHWRRKYGLAKSGRVITREHRVERFGGSWSVETALPEEIERVA